MYEIEFTMAAREHADALCSLAERYAVLTHDRLCATRPLVLAIDNETLSDDPALRLDLALLKAAPVAVVPIHSPFRKLEENGHRFLLANDGLYLEVRRPWLYFVHRLADQCAVPMPFGPLCECTELAFGRLSRAMPIIREFVAESRQAAPAEPPGLLAWDSEQQDLKRLQISTAAGVGAVCYEAPQLADHESLAIDIHSHGHIGAFFSATDDQDDAGSVKIAGVIGDLDKPTPSAMFRLCVLGLHMPIAVPAERIFGE